jgi:hypothetical protein
MKIHDVEQGSVEWLQLRAGIPTASELDNLVTPEWKVRTGAMPDTYLAKKLAEWWTGGSLAEWSTFDMEQGQLLENEARPWFELETGLIVDRVGFITNDSGTAGCSPDGIIADMNTGLEIKCPRNYTHAAYLLAGEVPKDYRIQVQASLYVTGWPSWQFVSYCRQWPKLSVPVSPIEEAQESIALALRLFHEKFAAAKERLLQLNGGQPKRLRKTYE